MFSEISKVVATLMREQESQICQAANLAGSNVPGYKSQNLNTAISFRQVLSGLNEYQGIKRVVTNFSDGNIKTTGRSLDFAATGDGFFLVSTSSDGRGGMNLLTRNGRFSLTKDGTLRTANNYVLLDARKRVVKIPVDTDIKNLKLYDNGDLVDVSRPENKLKISLFTVENKNDLDRIGPSYYKCKDDNELIPGAENCRLFNGCLENANISPIQEMARMIQSVRNFEMNQKIMRISSEISRQEQQKLI